MKLFGPDNAVARIMMQFICITFTTVMACQLAEASRLSSSHTAKADSSETKEREDFVADALVMPKVMFGAELTQDVELAKSNGLLAARTGENEVKFFTFLGGEEVTVRIASAIDNREKMNSDFKKVALEKLERLEKKFALTVSRNGVVSYAGKIGGSQPDRELEVRQPCLGEVLALEYALERSIAESQGKAQLQILFSTEILFPDRLAEWELSSHNKPTILVGASGGQWALDYILMHELAHHGQYKMGYDPLASQGWRFGKELGWSVFMNRLTGESGWAVATTDGSLYKQNPNLGKWVRCNKEGQPIDSNGKRVKRSAEARLLSQREMVLSAKIRPCTSYMTNPMEVQAEGLAMYRMGKTYRSRLLRKSPDLYKLVQEFDKKLIKREFGDGMMRAMNGIVVPSNNEIASEDHGLTI